MLFNSLTFIFLVLPITIIAYILAGKIIKKITIQNLVLLLVSLLFFAWSGLENLKILIILILANFIFGLLKDKCKKILLLGVIFDLGILIYYKYLDNIISSFKTIFSLNFDAMNIIVPVGISFIIFHCISYLLDIYNNKVKPSHNIINFALYVAFFPKLIQGPIVKYQDMSEELQNRTMNFNLFIEGIERFIIGLSKKVLMADIVGSTVSSIFKQSASGLEWQTAWIGVMLYAIQIYMDFSGYSDMAIGLGKMFGFHWKENFNFPYISTSITEFWRRWHISLGAWFREYLYIPLGGNRKGNVYVNLFIVFLATGIWHGATWLFLFWGILHGIFIVLERYLMKKSWYAKVPNIIKWFITMFVVCYGWIAFQISSVSGFIKFNKNLFGIGNLGENVTFTWQYYLTPHIITLIVIFILGNLILSRTKIQNWLKRKNEKSIIFNILKYTTMLGLLILCFISIVSSSYSPFIYFQF